jgi:hypothetical protein
MYRKHAWQRAGVTSNTFYIWLRDAEWKAEVEAAEADAVADVVSALYDDAVNAKVGQRAVSAAIFLERRHPGFYGRRIQAQVEVEHSGAIDVRKVLLSPAAVEAASRLEMEMQHAELAAPVIEGEIITALPAHEDAVDE